MVAFLEKLWGNMHLFLGQLSEYDILWTHDSYRQEPYIPAMSSVLLNEGRHPYERDR